ncbi:MAG TPA: hypothetical protein PK794_05770, partial [Armatimonadota bacterium]|nr:hypothetical protein [Armatimonadota bacterium]
PRGATRLFVSNHPEGIGRPQDPGRPEDTRWPPRAMEGKLWMDEVTADDAVNYRLFAYHQNWFAEPICLGVVVENLSTENRLAVSGEQVGLAVGASERNPLGLDNLTVIGKRNAYAELTNALFTPTPVLLLDPAPAPDAGTPGMREHLLHVWAIGGGSTFGARMRLYLRKVVGDPGPLRARVSTVWAWRQETLTTGLPLIPASGPHVRGSWPHAEIRLDNAGDPFDVGRNERRAAAVRWLWLCRPIMDAQGNKTYRDDVYFTAERSFNPAQAKTNNGSYGASTVMQLTVTNSANTDERVGIYLRYPHKTLPGVYVGAAATAVYDERLQTWMPGDARSVELANWTYTDRATNRVTFRDWRWSTKTLATYPVPAGATRVIPLTVTHDGPAMLPLAVVLRKEPKPLPPPPPGPGVTPAD